MYLDSVIVMSRNDGTLHQYDFGGAELAAVATGYLPGQGVATDGTNLFVSVWDGFVSRILEYDAALVFVTEHANPSGMSGDNLTDMVYDGRTDTWWGMDVSGDGGTGTNTSTLVEFTGPGGIVLGSEVLLYAIDGIGLNACP
ncbi:MAG: hypothetical protein ACI8PZ_002357 [Myxococcota bacterium]